MPCSSGYPVDSPRRFCARPGYSRHAVGVVDLHPRIGHGPGDARSAGHAGQLRRNPASRADRVDGPLARARIPANRLPPGMDAGSGRRLAGIGGFSRRVGPRVTARRAAPEPILLWRSPCRRAPGGNGTGRPDDLERSRPRPGRSTRGHDEVVSRDGTAGHCRSRCGRGPVFVDARSDSGLLRTPATGRSDLSRTQSDFLQSLRQQRRLRAGCGPVGGRGKAGYASDAASASDSRCALWARSKPCPCRAFPFAPT